MSLPEIAAGYFLHPLRGRPVRAAEGNRRRRKQDLTPEEIDEAFNDHDYLWYERPDHSFIAFSRLSSGRCLQIVFRKSQPKTYFIITAYDLTDSEVISMLNEEDVE